MYAVLTKQNASILHFNDIWHFYYDISKHVIYSGKEKNTSYELRVTCSNPQVTNSNPRVRRLKARVARLKARVGRLKSRVRR